MRLIRRIAARHALYLSALFLAVLVGVACAPQQPAETPADEEEAAETEAAMEEEPAEEPMAGEGATRITVAEQEPYGQYLANGNGRAVYLFTADSQGARESACHDACAEDWPPVTTEADPSTEAAAIDASLLGTIERPDGSRQVTYDGWPLYYFAQDSGPGDVTGQDVQGYGGEWYLVTPQGEMVHPEGSEEHGGTS